MEFKFIKIFHRKIEFKILEFFSPKTFWRTLIIHPPSRENQGIFCPRVLFGNFGYFTFFWLFATNAKCLKYQYTRNWQIIDPTPRKNRREIFSKLFFWKNIFEFCCCCKICFFKFFLYKKYFFLNVFLLKNFVNFWIQKKFKKTIFSKNVSGYLLKCLLVYNTPKPYGEIDKKTLFSISYF
jgi:magnesium-transporting ATPase (P-type)